jgi:DNA-binding response OmpR family regulator
MLVTDHDDTAELYTLALEHAGFAVQRFHEPAEVVRASRTTPPLAVVVHFSPRQDPAAVGVTLRSVGFRTVLLGLFSIQLPLTALRDVLETFDDVIMIPCSPEALVTRIVRLGERKAKQASA